MPKKPASEKQIESFVHDDASRRNIPPAEFQTMVCNQEKTPIQVAYERRNPDLDPQLIWRGKDLLDESPLVVNAPPLYIQEKIHPKVLIDNLKRRNKEGDTAKAEQIDLFAAFNGLPSEEAKTEFYQHDQNWSNRMILGDSLQVMVSLAEREGMRGKIQCIFFDPPYGIKFNSNFQWSTTSRTVSDGKRDHITREPEQVKAFRDTWRDGIHSYLSYLRDRLLVARDLLSSTGSIFVQIGDENIHLLRSLLDEVFGRESSCSLITYSKTTGTTGDLLQATTDYILWYAKDKDKVKYRNLCIDKVMGQAGSSKYDQVEMPCLSRRPITTLERQRPETLPRGARIMRVDNLTSPRIREARTGYFPISVSGRSFLPRQGEWKTHQIGMQRLIMASRVAALRGTAGYIRYINDFPAMMLTNAWMDIGGIQSRSDPKIYVVQTSTTAIQRCMLMTSDAGDLVLDPTCGSGTSATVAEQWGRRWITIDTSRVALALARARIMGARYPYYLLADSSEGKLKEAELTSSFPSAEPVSRNIRQGFVYERVPHITLKSIANNIEIDTIWEKWQSTLEPLREQLNTALGKAWQEWEIPREAQPTWSVEAKSIHTNWWDARIARQKEIDASIASKADSEYLYDRPYEDKSKVRVAGPFTVESLSPHRTMIVNDDDTITDPLKQGATAEGATDFAQMILNTLRVAGVQQAHKEDRISFESLDGWPGVLLAGKGSYRDADGTLKSAGIFIGPEFGTVTRVDLVEAARECADAGFDVLISCAFNYEAQSTEFDKLGPIPVLKARMNADLHMQQDLANSGKGNLFVIFGEPDIDILYAPDNQIQVQINGVDVFDPSTGEVRSDEPDNIACWFIDSDYNGESFFVRQAYFLGQNDPYKSLKTSLKAEIDLEAWESLNSDTSVPFAKPSTGRIAVKVINHLGDEVMKVYRSGDR
jgi:adenine-specific DNA-methyltransferase